MKENETPSGVKCNFCLPLCPPLNIITRTAVTDYIFFLKEGTEIAKHLRGSLNFFLIK